MGLIHNDPWVESHMWTQQHIGVKGYLEVHNLFLALTGMESNLILQWLHKYVIAKADETRGSITALLRKKRKNILTCKQSLASISL